MPNQMSERVRKATDTQIAALPRKRQRYVMADPEQRGLYLRVPPTGPVTFAVAVRDPYGKKPWTTLGTTADMGIDEARDRARDVIRRIKDGKSAFEPVPVKPDSYAAVVKDWLEQHVDKEGLRSADEIKRMLNKFVLPVWGDKAFVDIRRKGVNDLLNAITKQSGAWNADHTLSIIRKISNWYAAQVDEDYESPFVKGMRRTRSKDRARDRILNDAELRKVWEAAEANGTFGALVRILLLTAQRRGAVVNMKFDDIKDHVTPKHGDKPINGVWEIATEDRMKGTADAMQLPKAALAIIKAQPKLKSNPYVFAAARGNGPLNGFNKRKASFDKACGVSDWTLHDLRRTARSLMSRAGISEEHAERTLGHKQQGVKKVYDRYDYFKEKSDALAKLATLIEHIVHPVPNVVPLTAAAEATR